MPLSLNLALAPVLGRAWKRALAAPWNDTAAIREELDAYVMRRRQEIGSGEP